MRSLLRQIVKKLTNILAKMTEILNLPKTLASCAGFAYNESSKSVTYPGQLPRQGFTAPGRELPRKKMEKKRIWKNVCF